MKALYKPTVKDSLVRTLALNQGLKLRSYPQDLNCQEWSVVVSSIDGFALMSGIREPIQDMEMSAIIKFIRREFSDFTRDELEEAFSLYNAKKLEFKDSHYNTFSAAFLGSVLQSYRQYRRYNLTELNKFKKPSQQDMKYEKHNRMEYYKKSLFPKYNRVMNGENFETVFHPMDCWLFYQSLDDAGLIQINKEQRQKVWDEVRGNLSWFEATQRKKTPDKDMVINETKKTSV